MVNTDLSLWTPLLTPEARRQACVQYSGRCCNCGSSEHSLRWCPEPFQNVFSLLNPDFVTHDPDGSAFEAWKQRLRNWRRRNSRRGNKGNNNNGRGASGNGNFRPFNRSRTPAQGNNGGLNQAAPNTAAPSPNNTIPSNAPPGPAATAAPGKRFGPKSSR